jgi:hypothetical protein
LGDGEQQTALIAEPEKVLTDVMLFFVWRMDAVALG